MTLCETSTGRPRRFSDVLERLGGRSGDTLALGEIIDAFGDRAFGAVMLFFSIVNMLPWPPGGTTLTGAPLLLLSMELAWGRDTLWLPAWVERVSISRSAFRRLSARLMKAIRFSEALARPRLHFLTNPFGQGLLGLGCVFLSIVLVLPVWGGNLIPAVGLGLFSLGVMQRDGAAVLLGWLATGLTAAILFLAWKLVLAGFEAGANWVGQIF